MDLGELLSADAIALRVNARTKRQAISLIADLAARALNVGAVQVFTSLTEREALGSTGVGHGVAVPHARLPGLNRLHGVFVRLDQPVDFGSIDDRPVDLIFALLAPIDHPAEHLRALAKVSRALRQPELREQLRQAKSGDAIRALLVRDTRQTAA